jgi:RNase P/RNase MRP subunit p30
VRRFIDLDLNPDDPEKLKPMLKRAKKLGFSAVGIHVSIDGKPKVNKLDIVSRVDLTPDNPRTLLQQLRKVRLKYEVVSVLCKSKTVAIQAAKDHRVDILYYPHNVLKRRSVWFDKQQASLASKSNCHLEIRIRDLLGLEPESLAQRVNNLGKALWNANRENVPIIVSCGAKSLNEMREPRALSSILDFVDVKEEDSLDMISNIPFELVVKNREKLDGSFVSPGVWRDT